MTDAINESKSDAPMCDICRCDLENPTNYCSEQHEPFCRGCITSYIENKIGSSFFGSCPIVYCPSTTHQKGKKRKILPYPAWREHITTEVNTKYLALANSVLAFLCGGCHTLKSLDLGYESNRSSSCYKELEKLLAEAYGSNDKFTELEQHLQGYGHGEYSLEEIYNYIQELFPSLVTMSDEDAWNIFAKILKILPDPERRGNLHLRYLRDRPRMKTLCCNREHCFRCKIKDFHDGKTCAEATAALDQSIVTCPSCGIALARGDGCNTITCVCGKQFSWTQEKENTERSQAFLASYPEETSTHCAILLCTKTPPANTIAQAKAWQIRNRIEVNRALTDWFKKKYSPYPSQCCTVLPVDTLADGVKEAIDLWKNTHVAEVTKRKEENETALRSIFTNMVTDERDRPVMAYRLTNSSRRNLIGNVDEKLVQSAMKWIEKHRGVYTKGVEEYEERSARQFLFLHGNRLVKDTLPAFAQYPSGSEWCRTASNPDLTYTNNNTTVERVGSVSCYPAAFCKLTADKCMFRVVVDAAPKSSNWLTFGVARKGMANSSSDGVGRTANTWGLSDDRSSSSNYTIVAACGTEVAQFRKLRVGDTLSASIDTTEGWCEVNVNDDEFLHRFTIPAGNAEDYYFAMSFANDHRVTIISDMLTVKNSTPSKAGELNSDHTVMYNNLRKQLRTILAEVDETSTNPTPVSKLMSDGSEWIAANLNKSSLATETFEAMRPSIEAILGIRGKDRSNSEKEQSADVLHHMNWNLLLHAVSWYRHNRDRIREMKKTEMGLNFSAIHGDDASFMAAINLTEYHTHKVEKEDTLASLAYMHMFPEEMNAWYDYNASLREPVIENIAKNCRCLPRHSKTCPLAAKK